MTTITDIQRAVCSAYKLHSSCMVVSCRERRFVRPRQLAMHLAYVHTKNSLPQIGRSFGGRHHTTVLHAYRQIASLRRLDGGLNEIASCIEAELYLPEKMKEGK